MFVNIDVVIHSKLNQQILFRTASQQDIDLTYQWANNQVIRQYAFEQKFIDKSEHKNWFINKLNSDDCLYLIATLNGDEIGSVRFDLQNTKATISYLLDPQYHCKGLGRKMLEQAISCLTQQLPNIEQLVGDILKENIASKIIFEKLGFEVEVQLSYSKIIKT